jgi:hypothetical protein
MASQPIQQYRIIGRVIDRVSRKGVQGVRVEGWDRDTRFHDMLGSAVTDGNGGFTFTFDSNYFGDFAGDHAPDVFFKVYLDDRVIKTTFDTPMMNQPPGDVRATIEIDYAQAAPTGTDRVSTDQAVKAVRFVKQSDFAGVFREGRDKAATVGGFAGALGRNAFAKFDLEPIGPKGTRNNEITGQDTATATRNLAASRVNVAEVKDYDPQADGASVRAIVDFPLALKADDTVTLYQQDGKVQYYSIVKPVAATQVDAGTVARIDRDVQTLKVNAIEVAAVRADLEAVKANTAQSAAQLEGDVATMKARVEEVARLKAELAAVQQSAADKDVQILKLQSDMANMQAAQRDINSRFSPDKLAALEQQVRQLSQASPRVVSQPAPQTVKPLLTRTAKTAKTTTKPKPGKGR